MLLIWQAGTKIFLNIPWSFFLWERSERITAWWVYADTRGCWAGKINCPWRHDVRLGVETYSDGVLHEIDSSPPLFIAENNITQTLGQYRLVATSMNPAPSFNGSGNIVKITFNPLSLGDSILDLESQLSDYPPLDREPRISFPIDHTTMDSTVTIYETTSTPTPTSPTTSPTITPTPTLTPIPTSTPEPPISNLKIEYILAILAIIVVPVLVYLILRRRK